MHICHVQWTARQVNWGASASPMNATEVRTWDRQFCLPNDEPCGFGTFLCFSVATHVSACGMHVITMKHHICFGRVQG